MSVYNGRVVHQHSKELKAWRNAIANACRAKMEPLEGAVTVRVVFVVEQKRSVRRAEPYVRPDIDKYARAVLDALTGFAFHDDGQVTDLHATKVYGPQPGAIITVEGTRGSVAA